MDAKEIKKMSCWDRFDRKVVLYFTGNKDTRVPGMERELKRVGLDDADRQWQFKTPFDGLLLGVSKHEPCMNIPSVSNLIAQYRAIATAFQLGRSSVLVLEDDVRFFNDVEKVFDFVGSLPDDYDIAKFDSLYKEDRGEGVTPSVMGRWRDERKKNELWSEFDSLYSTGCCAYSRKGMERIVSVIEKNMSDKVSGRLRPFDFFLDRGILGNDMKMYFSRENVCAQREFVCNTGYDEVLRRYSKIGCEISEYSSL